MRRGGQQDLAAEGFGLRRCNRWIVDELNKTGKRPEAMPITTRDALAWTTINGARVAGLADRTGCEQALARAQRRGQPAHLQRAVDVTMQWLEERGF